MKMYVHTKTCDWRLTVARLIITRLEITHISTDQWLDNWTMVQPFNKRKLSSKKEWATDTCKQCEWISWQYAKWKKTGIKDHLPHDSTYKAFQKRQNYRDRNQIRSCQQLGREEGDNRFQREYKGHFLCEEYILYLCYGGGYMTACIFQNSSNGTPKKDPFYCV